MFILAYHCPCVDGAYSLLVSYLYFYRKIQIEKFSIDKLKSEWLNIPNDNKN